MTTAHEPATQAAGFWRRGAQHSCAFRYVRSRIYALSTLKQELTALGAARIGER
jgi:hypothetical protein